MAKPIDKIGRVSSASVEKCTGKNWDQWLKILNTAGARGWTHQEIVAWLKKKYKLGPWWQQGVTHGFEVATGRRIDGQSLKGTYTAGAVRTVAVSAKVAWKKMWTEEGLAHWIGPMSPFEPAKGETYEIEGGIFGEVRTVKPFTQVRMTWQDEDWLKPSIVHFMIHPRDKNKCAIMISHTELKTPALREKMRAFWKTKLDDVRKYLANGDTRRGTSD